MPTMEEQYSLVRVCLTYKAREYSNCIQMALILSFFIYKYDNSDQRLCVLTTCFELVQGLDPLYLFTGVSSITFPQMHQDINSICCEVQSGKRTQQNHKSISKLLYINDGTGRNPRTNVKVLFHYQTVQMDVLYYVQFKQELANMHLHYSCNFMKRF